MFPSAPSYYKILPLIITSTICVITLITHHDLSYQKTEKIEDRVVQIAEIPTNEFEERLKPIKILIIAFPRSGSSLVGSILSAKSTSTYFFEPYHWKHFNHKNGSKLDLHFFKVEEKFISDFTNGLFDCNKPELIRQKDSKSSMIGRYEGCYQSEQIVVKAVRLHSNNLLPWIVDTDIKVVQLVRDPRAILNSQFKARKLFGEWANHEDSLCEMMSDDAKLALQLPPNRFTKLLYEDLIRDPIKALSSLYQKLELPIDTWSLKAAVRHLGEVPTKLMNGTTFYSLYRGPQHDMNAWKYKMKKEDLIEIETKCEKTLKEFGYM